MIEPKDFIKNMANALPDISVTQAQRESIFFEERVKLNCHYCGKYGVNWKCPPNIPTLNYETMLSEYQYLCLVYKVFHFEHGQYTEIRTESSVYLHKTLLKMEEYLFEQSDGMCASFIGGSCKLCKNGCGKDKCNNPYQARIPLEATGINIVKTALANDIVIRFPVKDRLIRIGLIMW